MAGNENAQSLPPLGDEVCAFLFEEAIQAKMVPYDVMVWSRYLFDRIETNYIGYLVNVFWSLLNDYHVEAKEIGTWCKRGIFYYEAIQRIQSPPQHNFLIPHRDELSIPTNDYTYTTICTNSNVQRKWLEQSRYCLASTECQITELTPKRWTYFLMGIMIWEMKPERDWAIDLGHENLDAYAVLGWDIVASTKRLKVEDLLQAYNAAFSQQRGVGRMSFEEFNDGITATKSIVEQINPDIPRNRFLLSKITRFFQNLPPQKKDSVLCLKYVLKNKIHWEKVLGFYLFEDAAQDYGYTILRQYENTFVDVNAVESNLRKAYIIAIDHNQMALHRACKEHDLAKHVSKVCSDNSFVLHPKALELLQTADFFNKELQSQSGLTRHEGNP